MTRTGGATALTNGAGYYTFHGVANGNYTLTLSTIPTDDHPDATEWTFADNVSIDAGNGSNAAGASAAAQ